MNRKNYAYLEIYLSIYIIYTVYRIITGIFVCYNKPRNFKEISPSNSEKTW